MTSPVTMTMTKAEALTNAVEAAKEAQKFLEKGNADLAYSWSVIADTWASIASNLPGTIYKRYPGSDKWVRIEQMLGE